MYRAKASRSARNQSLRALPRKGSASGKQPVPERRIRPRHHLVGVRQLPDVDEAVPHGAMVMLDRADPEHVEDDLGSL
jgi:hypothetical protein